MKSKRPQKDTRVVKANMKVYLVIALGFAVTACLPSPEDRERISIDLGQYELALRQEAIAGVAMNASGLAYSRKTKTLFLAMNSPPEIVELNLKGEFKRRIALNGFDDTEGITWIDGYSLAVVEERRGNLVIVEIDADTKSIDHTQGSSFSVESVPLGNMGLEGLAWDSGGKRFFIVKELAPKKIYTLKLPTEKSGKPEVTIPWEMEENGFGLKDLAGVHYDARTGHLLILSQASRCVVECTVDGRELSRLSLEKGSAGLDHSLLQPEGITMDRKGNLYICGEPNVFYVFTRKRR